MIVYYQTEKSSWLLKEANMANLETLSKSVENKLQMLKFTNEDVKQVLEGKHAPSMERKVKTLQGNGKYSSMDYQDRR